MRQDRARRVVTVSAAALAVALLPAPPAISQPVIAQTETRLARAPVAHPPLVAAPAAPAPVADAAAPLPDAAAPDPTLAGGRVRHAPGDPLERINRRFYAINQALDRAIVRPLALGYAKVVPKVVRGGIRNVFVNLTEPIVFLNDLLQLKPKRAVRTLGRFVINTTLGIGGLIDVARAEKLPHRDNGFGNTLGRYGVKPGPYLYLPIFGPSTLRDLGGGTADGLVLPTAVGSPFDRTDYTVVRTLLTGLDQRAEVDAELQTLTESALDPYATLRSVYLQSRAAAIAEVKGGAAAGGAGGAALDDPLDDPGTSAPPADTDTPADPTPPTPDAAPAGEAAGPAVPAAGPVPPVAGGVPADTVRPMP